MSEETTTIQVDREVRDRLEGLKIHPSENLDSVVKRILQYYTGGGTVSAAKMHWRTGNKLFDSGKYEYALKEFTEAIKADNNYGDAYYNRALTYRMLHNINSAREDLNMTFKLQPETADADTLMGELYEAEEDFPKAKLWYEKALTKNANFSFAKKKLQDLPESKKK